VVGAAAQAAGHDLGPLSPPREYNPDFDFTKGEPDKK